MTKLNLCIKDEGNVIEITGDVKSVRKILFM